MFSNPLPLLLIHLISNFANEKLKMIVVIVPL